MIQEDPITERQTTYPIEDRLDVNDDNTAPENSDDTSEQTQVTDEPIQLGVVENFPESATSVYEAVMIAAQRARQIGRTQKSLIDQWLKALEKPGGSEVTDYGDEDSVQEFNPDESAAEHFKFEKPTILALRELKNRAFQYRYEENNDQ